MKKQHWTLVLAGVLLSAAVFCGYQRWGATKGAPREELLALLPSDASAVIFLDLKNCGARHSWQNCMSGRPSRNPCRLCAISQDTGFDYERDLHRIAFATKKKGQDSVIFAIADGKFDRAKNLCVRIKVRLSRKEREYEVYSVPQPALRRKFLLCF